MSLLKTVVFPIIFAVFSATAGAADNEGPPLSTVQEVVSAVEGVYGQAESLRADFVQVTRSVALGEEQRQRGKVVMMRPRMMRWDFTAPDTKLFVTDGKTMWVWSPDDNQVIIYDDVSGGGSGMASLFTDLNQLDELFEIQILDSHNKTETLTAHDCGGLIGIQAPKKNAAKPCNSPCPARNCS